MDRIETITRLRAITGAGVKQCADALTTSGGDEEQALKVLAQQGVSVLAKVRGRATGAGIVAAFTENGMMGAMVQLECETDFVARTEIFIDAAYTIARQIATNGVMDLENQWLLSEPNITVGQFVAKVMASTGENVVIRKAVSFNVGGRQEEWNGN